MWWLTAAVALAADVPSCADSEGALPCEHVALERVDRWGMPSQGLDARSPFLDLCADGGDCAPKRTSDFMLLGSAAVGLASASLWMIPQDRGDPLRVEPWAAWGGAVGGTFVLTSVMKGAASRPRPYTYSAEFADRPWEERKLADHRHSFFSGHTSLAAASLFYGATSYALYADAPDPALTAGMYGVALGGTAWTGFTRVRAGKHFASDVITGGLVGALLGIAAPVATVRIARLAGGD